MVNIQCLNHYREVTALSRKVKTFPLLIIIRTASLVTHELSFLISETGQYVLIEIYEDHRSEGVST